MQKIVPHLWFDTEAKEAAEFYVSAFPDSKVTNVTTLRGTPSGDCDVVSFTLTGQSFMAISAGPVFKFNPSISFMVGCKVEKEVDVLWEKLSEGGTALMELGAYPFSKKYGWTQDKYGLSWQVMLTDKDVEQKITPNLLFVGNVCGKAEEAIRFYTSVFRDAEIGEISRYGEGQEPNRSDMLNYASFTLEGQQFAAMDSALMHEFTFNEAVSLMVNCDTQEEIDSYWDKLSAVPEAEQCGWLKDKYGVSWQIVPSEMGTLMASGDEERTARVTEAFLKMKKFDLKTLERAAKGE